MQRTGSLQRAGSLEWARTLKRAIALQGPIALKWAAALQRALMGRPYQSWSESTTEHGGALLRNYAPGYPSHITTTFTDNLTDAALLANPLVARYNVARPLLDALLEANRAHLPRFFARD